MKELREFTMARVGLGRAGNSLPTRELLNFQLAHARARDAVHFPLDAASLRMEMEARGWQCVTVRSAAADRAEYLKRPDLGRRLAAGSRERAAALRGSCLFVVADGLSALAVHRHSVPLLAAVFKGLGGAAPVVIVEQGRVAIGDEIGELAEASMAVMLIGERPGLSSPDSLGVYLTWGPRVGRTDAERNCISNIRAEGLAPQTAATVLLWLIAEARRLRLSGVGLRVTSGQNQYSGIPRPG